MAEFIEACTGSMLNLIASVLLGLTTLYWLVVILGAVGIDSLDFDFDADTGLDTDLDLDTDTPHGMLQAGIGASILRFFHIGTVPVLVLWSVFILAFWMVGVLSYPLIGKWGGLLQLAALVPMVIGSLLLTKVLTLPLKALFARMKEQEEAEQKLDLIGRRGTVVSLTVTHRLGQVEIPTNGAPLRLNVRTSDDRTMLSKGDEAVVIGQDAKSNVYVVRGFWQDASHDHPQASDTMPKPGQSS